jgi:hypothetical protein
MVAELISNPGFARALVVGVFGGAGLVLTAVYSRRGPTIYPVYAALVVSLTLLLARYAELSYAARFAAALGGFVAATLPFCTVVTILANRRRDHLRRTGRLPPGGHVPLLGHLWRAGFMVLVGSIVSAAIA